MWRNDCNYYGHIAIDACRYKRIWRRGGKSPRALSGSWIGRECVEYSGDFLMLITRLELGTNTKNRLNSIGGKPDFKYLAGTYETFSFRPSQYYHKALRAGTCVPCGTISWRESCLEDVRMKGSFGFGVIF